MGGSPFASRNLAVFIDYENLDREGLHVDSFILGLSERGRLLIKRAYADWGRFPSVKQEMLRAGVELIELPSISRGKNRADIRLVVDAMEVAMTRDYIDTFVIVSGDSDFLPLATKLRELNRYVVIIARKASASSLLANCCDELIYYSEKEETVCKKLIENLDQLEELFKKALLQLEAESKEARLSTLKSRLLRIDPSFTQSKYGFSQFKPFLQQIEKLGALKLSPMENGDSLVELPSVLRPVVETFSKTQPQTPVTGLTAFFGPLPTEILDRIFWAVRFRLPEGENTISLSILSTAVKKIFPAFRLRDYGFPREGGWRKLAQVMEQDRWCDVTKSAEKHQYQITLTEEFFEREVIMPEPGNFAQLKSDMAARFSADYLKGKSTVAAQLSIQFD